MPNMNRLNYIRPVKGGYRLEVKFESALTKGSVYLTLTTSQLLDPLIDMLVEMPGDERVRLINVIVEEVTALAKK
jgi:hypothetical protein